MNTKGAAAGVEESAARVWRFADCELDELRRELRVHGTRVDLESKPLEILLQLLVHAGEVVTKEELLEAVWPSVMVVDGSLATAVSKLRKALGEDENPVILTIPRVGYRLAVPVSCRVMADIAEPELHFHPGDAVPGRDQWQLIHPLERSGSSEVWIAEHPKTREERVFKFAADGVRLRGLKREVTVARLLRESLGERPEYVRILEWNFEIAPYFLESEFGGPNLAEWAEGQSGLGSVPLATRLQMLTDIAKAVAAAHGVGVLHKDLKPANILVAPASEGKGWQVRIADFGSASLFDPGRLRAMGITNLGFTQNAAQEDGALTGTLMYLAPEVLAGQAPSAAGDVYALGVLLYQVVIGDLRRPLAPGWELALEDSVLRETIAIAACGDPEQRLASAAELAEQLNSLEERRARRDALAVAQQRAQAAERQLAAERARRPWIVLAGIALVAGLSVSLVLYGRAIRESQRASRQTAIAVAINRFLSDDLLGRSNPFQTGHAGESLVEAIRQASPAIDQQFRGEPLVAAHLHQTIARALDNRTDYPDARGEYDRAATLFRQADGDLSQDAIVVQLQRATLEARSYERGSLPLAKTILAQQDGRIAQLAQPRPDLPVWEASAKGMIALIDNDAKTAAEQFRTAVTKANALPIFDEPARLTFQQRLGFSYIRLGDGAKAEQLFRELIVAFTRLTGPENPNVLRLRLNLAQAYMIENKFADSVREANAIYPSFIAALGPEHELTMQLLTTRAQSEGSLEMWDDAIRDDLAIHALAAKKQGPLSFFAIATLSDASLAMCRAGRYTEGTENALRALDASRQAFGAAAALTGGAGSTLAGCLIGLGRVNEAEKLLSGIDIPAVAQLTGDPDWGAGIQLMQAQIAYRRKDYAAAEKYAQAITPVFMRPRAEVYQRDALQALMAGLHRAHGG